MIKSESVKILFSMSDIAEKLRVGRQENEGTIEFVRFAAAKLSNMVSICDLTSIKEHK